MRTGQQIIEYYTKKVGDVFVYTAPELREWRIGVLLADMANEIAQDVRRNAKKD
jgi:hypothetical protein